jgi:hypothetical protein
MIIKAIKPITNATRENHRELAAILNELSIWHYRIQSTLLVASSALVASFFFFAATILVLTLCRILA